MISGGTAAHRARVRRAMRPALRVARTIRATRLRRCVIVLLRRRGDIEIEDPCEDPDLLGWNWEYWFGRKWGASDTIHLCVDNNVDDDELADTIVHEFAHACCWEHGDPGGVPP